MDEEAFSAAGGAVVVVLGGNEGERRAKTAAAVFRRERAAAVLVTGTARECREMRAVLCREGVPERRVALVPGAIDTFGNARDADRWIRRGPVSRVWVVSSEYHLPRVRLLFAPRLADLAIPVDYVAAPTALSRAERARMRRLEAMKICVERVRQAVERRGGNAPLDGRQFPG